MKKLATLLLLGSVALAPAAHGQAPAAPAAPVLCGDGTEAQRTVPPNNVSQCEVHRVLVLAGDGLQIIRNRNLIFGNVPRPVIVGSGTFVDIEANPAGPAITNVRYEYAPDYRIPALREYVKPATGNPIIRVVKGDRAWNEGPRPGTNPMDVTDANAIALRKVRLWLWPHAIIRAAAFASKGLCPTGEKCPDVKLSIDGNKTINVTLYGNTYKVTLDADDRPATVETTARGMTFVATYSGYRDGKGMSGGKNPGVELIGRGSLDDIANATDVLDKYRYGVYYPERVVHTINGRTVLDVRVTQGWTNRYNKFPDPELVRAAAK